MRDDPFDEDPEVFSLPFELFIPLFDDLSSVPTTVFFFDLSFSFELE